MDAVGLILLCLPGGFPCLAREERRNSHVGIEVKLPIAYLA